MSFDLFLPPDPDNLLQTWHVCDELGFSLHIVRSKTAAGRDKDRLLLATHADSLRQMLEDDEDEQ